MKKHFLSLITICLIALTFTSCELLALIGLANEVEKYNDEVTNYSVTIEWADGKEGTSYVGVYEYGKPVTLKVNATTKTGGISYQWYSFNASDSYTSAKAISNATKDTYTVPNTAELDKYYYCRATNKSETKYYDDTNYIHVKFTMFEQLSGYIDEVRTLDPNKSYYVSDWVVFQKKVNIPAGTVIKFLNGAQIETSEQGLINATGAEDNPVIFTSFRDDSVGRKYVSSDGTPKAGDWEFVESDALAGSLFDFCEFRYGTNALKLNEVESTVTNCIFRNNASGEDRGALNNNTLDSTIENCVFYNNDCPLYCQPDYTVSTTNVFHKDDIKNRNQYIRLDTGYMDSAVWAVTELPYMLGGSWTELNANKYLTVGSGVVCKFLSSGKLELANGSDYDFADDCIFTSFRDDAHGGDSDGDGGDPKTGDWEGIIDHNTGTWLTGSNIKYAEFHN